MKAKSAICALLVAACQTGTLHHTFQPVADDGWAVTDTLRFDLPELPGDSALRLRVGLRVTGQMPYRTLRLVLEQRSDTQRLRDTLTLLLADDRGTWFAGGTVLHETESGSLPMRVPPHPSRQLLLYHIMPRHTLPGITEAGIRVAKE